MSYLHSALVPSLTRVSVEEDFMKLLFDHRRIFHHIAIQHVESGSSPIAVCWIDFFLAKLADAVVVYVGPTTVTTPANDDLPPSIIQQQEEYSVRAAAQLPGMCSYTQIGFVLSSSEDQLHSICNVFGSQYSSQAATRLALRLLFAIEVMGPQLREEPLIDDRRYA